MWGRKSIAVMSWMQMRYAFHDPRYIQIERMIKLVANVWSMMIEILQELWNQCMEIVNQDLAFCKDRPACNSMCS